MLTKKMKIGDLLIVAFILLFCVLIFMWKPNTSTSHYAELSLDGIVQWQLLLPCEPHTIEGAYPFIIETDGHRVRFLSSECPDQICVTTGWIEHTGETAVCLPYKAILTIKNGNPTEVDAITQ